MKDYYADYLRKNSKNPPETELTELTKGAFVSSVSEHPDKNSENFVLEALFEDRGLRAQFDFEVEERAAIILADGELSEAQAYEYAKKTTAEMWQSLFVG